MQKKAVYWLNIGLSISEFEIETSKIMNYCIIRIRVSTIMIYRICMIKLKNTDLYVCDSEIINASFYAYDVPFPYPIRSTCFIIVKCLISSV